MISVRFIGILATVKCTNKPCNRIIKDNLGDQTRKTNITNKNYALEIMEQPSEIIWIQELLDTHNASNPKASNFKINNGGLVPHRHGKTHLFLTTMNWMKDEIMNANPRQSYLNLGLQPE